MVPRPANMAHEHTQAFMACVVCSWLMEMLPMNKGCEQQTWLMHVINAIPAPPPRLQCISLLVFPKLLYNRPLWAWFIIVI